MTACVYCQEPLEAGWATCPACLTPTTASLECEGCGRALRTTWRQCPTCGRDTPWASAASQAIASRSSDRTPRAEGQTGLAGFTDAGSSQTAVDLEIGSTVAQRYVVLTKLGSGGFGDVYRAFDLLTRDERALKTVWATTDRLGRQAEHLLQEFRVTDQVTEHRHVIRVYDPAITEHRGQPLVLLPMQLADGGNLRQWMQAHRDPQQRRPEAIRLFLEACRGIEALHRRDLVHLDLKPENILLHQGAAKVADFGIGRILGPRPDQNLISSSGLGTAQYMSPEQHARTATGDIGAPSDIYGLGVILHELLSGTVPFVGERRELRRWHLEETPVRPTEIGPQWWSIVARCLAKAPSDRFASVSELIASVETTPLDDAEPSPAPNDAAWATPIGQAVIWFERFVHQASATVDARLMDVERELRALADEDAAAARQADPGGG